MEPSTVSEKISRSNREAPPAHYILKIQSFSKFSEILNKTGLDKYESGVFDVGGYKWKLVIYPKGNERKNGKGHISLYLAVVHSDELLKGNRVDVDLKFLVYNRTQNNYLVLEDGKVKSYSCLNTENGFDQLLPLSTFEDSSNGYLVDDCCIFGVEFQVLRFASEGQKFNIIEPEDGTFTWKIEKFSTLTLKQNSQVFEVGRHKWFLSLYPKGDGRQKDGSPSLFLCIDCSTLAQNQVYAEFKLLIKDQLNGIHRQLTSGGNSRWFNDEFPSWGFPSFITLSDLKDPLKGFLVNDSLTVEAEITRVSFAEALSMGLLK